MKNVNLRGDEFVSAIASGRVWPDGQEVRVEGRAIFDGGLHDFRAGIKIKNVHFSTQVIMHNFKKGSDGILFNKCVLVGGLEVSSCDAETLNVTQSAFGGMSCSCSSFERVFFHQNHLTKSMDLSGLEVRDLLGVTETEYAHLVLLDHSSLNSFVGKRVFTDKALTALHFRMAGIPVLLETETVKELLAGSQALQFG